MTTTSDTPTTRLTEAVQAAEGAETITVCAADLEAALRHLMLAERANAGLGEACQRQRTALEMVHANNRVRAGARGVKAWDGDFVARCVAETVAAPEPATPASIRLSMLACSLMQAKALLTNRDDSGPGTPERADVTRLLADIDDLTVRLSVRATTLVAQEHAAMLRAAAR